MTVAKAAYALNEIQVISSDVNELVIVKGRSEKLECIGLGTDAAVFRLFDEPNYAFKVYSNDKLEKIKIEKQVYEKLGQSDYFPNLYGSGKNFLMISFEPGMTLYDCLTKGIHIPTGAIEDVESARRYAAKRGLNPRDIHLKNILLHEGRAKLIDVSEYMKVGDDRRWEYLKKGYLHYYHLIDGREIPLWMIEVVRKWYNYQRYESFDFDNFIKKLMMLFKNHSKLGKKLDSD